MKVSWRAIMWAALSMAMLAFIFGNSLQSGADSLAISDTVAQIYAPTLERIGFGDEQISFLVRKLAHFAEFMLLGFLFSGTARAFSVHRSYLAAVSSGWLAGAADEFIQRFIDGRSAQVTDVLIDCIGVAAGIGFYCLFFRLSARDRQTKSVS
ncbi:MAG: VanZ family protein [Clostridia bacterium]|nr:VanZ family protein [Clostridia bacterium]